MSIDLRGMTPRIQVFDMASSGFVELIFSINLPKAE